MQKITVKKIETKSGRTGDREWMKITVHGEDDARFGSFDRKLAQLNEGDVIEAEIEVKAKGNDIVKWELVQAAPSTQPAGMSTEAAQIIADAILKGLNEIAGAIRENKHAASPGDHKQHIEPLPAKAKPAQPTHGGDYDMNDLLNDLTSLSKVDAKTWGKWAVINDIAKITGETCSTGKEAVELLHEHFPAEYSVFVARVREAADALDWQKVGK